MLGDGAFYVALAWQVYDLSPQPTALSVVLAARSIPMLLLLLVGGAITDRFPRRIVMLASDVIRGADAALLAVLAATGALELWHVVVLAAVFGAADAFFYPAYTSILPEILDTDLLLQANALESVVRPLALRMAGPALGGFVGADRHGRGGCVWRAGVRGLRPRPPGDAGARRAQRCPLRDLRRSPRGVPLRPRGALDLGHAGRGRILRPVRRQPIRRTDAAHRPRPTGGGRRLRRHHRGQWCRWDPSRSGGLAVGQPASPDQRHGPGVGHRLGRGRGPRT